MCCFNTAMTASLVILINNYCRVDNVLPLDAIYCEPGTYCILSHSSRQVKVWYIMQLYSRLTNMGSPSRLLQATSHPLVPLRVLAGCDDSAVRVVSPITGEVLTTALLSVQKKVHSICYFPLQGITTLHRSYCPYSSVVVQPLHLGAVGLANSHFTWGAVC